MFFIMTKKNIFEFDGMPIDISETDFLKKRSEAKLLLESDDPKKTRTYLYVPPKNIIFEKAKVISSARVFVADKGCGLGIGFQFFGTEDIKRFMNHLKNQYKQSQNIKSLGNKNQIIYLENEEVFGSVVLPNQTTESKPSSVNYSTTLKSCGIDLAHTWQTSAR